MMIRNASSALIPLREAANLLSGAAAPVAPATVTLAAALGRVAAGVVIARSAVPAGLTAMRDGFAVEAASVGGASAYAPIFLGRPPPWVEAGQPLPSGTDAVLPPEGFLDGMVVADIAPREGVFGTGDDVAGSERLIEAGTRIEPLHLLVLEAVGLTAVDVRQPLLRVVTAGATGLDTVSPLLGRLIARAGAATEAVRVQGVRDIAEALRGGTADAVLVIGGSGFGRSDHSAAALALAGEVRAHGIAMRPGETTAVGSAAGKPVLLVPGRPEAALAAFLALGRPLIARLAGAQESLPRRQVLLRKIVSSIGLSEVVFVRSGPDGVEPLGGAGLPLSRLVQANGIVVVEPDSEGFRAGEEVEVWAL
ncbi:molybdopterin biosynthesis enzyme [Methylobacterium sp. PvR107]|nr:molybdopterin biosynthesis enzyme [Methylobacterium sp. PvR107]